ncbi:MAG: hypothetical protein C5B60_05005 [Chloroflexi bacterium]|nr:MAG: hypothetical protein C5B60_05005 [Chloroflexota bacterium]
MTKVIEILFRRKVGLLALLLLPTVAGAAVAWFLPREYQASAGLWALRRYEIIGATGPESDLTTAPAGTQATTLGELLLTRSFALSVAYDTDLPKTMARSNPTTQGLEEALYNEISLHVVAAPQGYNLFEITYANTDPVVALQVVTAVVSHYGADSVSQAAVEGEQLLISYQKQLSSAQQVAQKAITAAAEYLKAHSLTDAQAAVDPQYQLLVAEANQANAEVTTVQDDINTVQQQLATLSTGSSGLYTVIDAPKVPSHPVSRTKTFLLAGGIGIAAGLMAAIGYFITLVRLDQSLYSRADVPEVTVYAVQVQIPRLPRRSIQWAPKSSGRFLLKRGKQR